MATASNTTVEVTPSNTTVEATSNYDYMSVGKCGKVKDSSTDMIVDSIKTLVALRKSECQVSPAKENGEGETLKYRCIYANLDRLLQRLPEYMVDDLNVEFLILARNAVRQFEDSNVIVIDKPT